MSASSSDGACLPLSCPYCGQPIIVEYVADRYSSASVTCPNTECQKIAKIGGASQIVSVRADPLREPR